MNSNQNIYVKRQSATDSLFGMALAQAFLGVAYGPCIDLAWEAGEVCSALYEDSLESKKRTNGRGVYALGDKGKLAGTFTRNTTKKNEPFLPKFWMEPASSHALTL